VSIAIGIVAYSTAVADLPLTLAAPLDDALLAALDVEGKIPRALESLGPIGGRETGVVAGGRREVAELAALGGQLTEIGALREEAEARPEASFDVITSRWSAFHGADPAELAAADRLLRPEGRLLVVHDYGRDDVSRLRGDRPEYRLWSRRDGPFLSAGFRIRVIHCFWTFTDLAAATAFLTSAFPSTGEAVAAELKRPRVTYNVAVYHRTRGETGRLEG
jgi:SAM-dependent methyltransferase